MGGVVALDSAAWAAWAGVAVTTLTFAIALVLFLIGLRDRRRAAEDRERDQARKVWVWATETGFMGDSEQVPEFAAVQWSIENFSADPVINCRVGLLTVSRAKLAASSPAVAIVRPGRSEIGISPVEDAFAQKLKASSGMRPPPPPVQLIFTDAAGVQWWRDSYGNISLWRRPRYRRSWQETAAGAPELPGEGPVGASDS